MNTPNTYKAKNIFAASAIQSRRLPHINELLFPPVIRTLEKSQLGRLTLRTYRSWTSTRHPGKDRILCVGFRKTGTSSYAKAMRLLGFSHYGFDRDLEKSAGSGNLERCLTFAEHFDSFDDLPWSRPEFVRAFRERFPGSRYVLLERDEKEWLDSFLRFSKSITCPNQALLKLRQHQEEILHVLVDEPHVLRLNICAGEGFEKLCPFLGVEIPPLPFPWENRRVDSEHSG